MAQLKQIETVVIEKLIPYVNNAKKHSDDQVTRIASSIREFGFVNPVLIDKDYNIIAGHGRVMAAKKLGWDEVPCLFVEGLTEAQRKAYILADNRLGELAEWDMNLVGLELGELSEMDFDIDLTGFELPNVDMDDFGTSFDLADGGKPEICQMTFTLHEEQKKAIQQAIDSVGDCVEETFGNTNRNGNALYEVIRQWAELKK
jgi:hypothetical protein